MATAAELKAAIDKLVATVKPETDASDAIEALLAHVVQLYNDALAGSNVPAEQIAAIEAVSAQLTANTQKIVDATLANTPAEPPTP